VYVEKPVSVDAAEAEEMVDRATAAGRLLCAGHDHLYDPVWQRCREIVASGRLGAVVHVDSVHGYSLGGPYGALLAADPDHWVHKLPGGLFHNVMSHALYKITDYLRDEMPRIAGFSFSPPGGPWFPTELRVLIHGRHVTGALTFTASALPAQRVVRVLGTRGSIEVDFDGRLIRSMPSPSMPGPLARVEIPWRQFREAWGNWKRNASRLLHADLHFFAGMQCLFTEFYRAILEDGAPPIAYDEIVRVARISDAIFASAVDRAAPGGEREAVPTRQPELEEVRA
jgi:predicted dehydrogenase